MSADMFKMDEKNARLTMSLKAKSGYSAKIDAPAVSAVQWGAIQAVIAEADSEIGRSMLALFREHLA